MGLVRKIWRSGQLGQGNWSFLRNRWRGIRLDGPPIFILGCGHSGTSLLLKILDVHSKIYGVPYESRLMFKNRVRIALMTRLWTKAAIAEGKTRWVEKTPAHVHHIGRIFSVFPEARVLLMIRDGRDVALSLNKRWNNFERATDRWIGDNQAGQKWWAHPQVCKAAYEDIVSDFEPTLRRICGFVGVPYEEHLVDFHEKPTFIFGQQIKKPDSEAAGEDHKNYRNWQINQKLFNARGKWASELSEQDKAIFKAKAGAMLVEYGYAKDLDW
jgi:hypothetical protein